MLARWAAGPEECVLVLGGEDVYAELGGDLVADAQAADAVAVDVETGREDADAELARDDGEDPPLTPLLAGTPTSYAHWPAASYIPHVYTTLSRSRTRSRGSARSPVNGLTAPLASVAAMTASCAQVT